MQISHFRHIAVTLIGSETTPDCLSVYVCPATTSSHPHHSPDTHRNQQPCIPALPSTAPPLTHSPFLTIFSSEPQRPERLLTGDTMFIAFFYYLRARGLKVSTTEWLTLMQALAQGMEH